MKRSAMQDLAIRNSCWKIHSSI